MTVPVIEFIRALVRPTTTWGLVAAFIWAAFYDREVAALIAGPMGLTLGWYFRDREGGS